MSHGRELSGMSSPFGSAAESSQVRPRIADPGSATALGRPRLRTGTLVRGSAGVPRIVRGRSMLGVHRRADNGTYVDPRAGRIALIEWVNEWYPAQDLEPTTLVNYKYAIEVHILPRFGSWALSDLTAEEVGKWEREIVAQGFARRTARDARTTPTTIL